MTFTTGTLEGKPVVLFLSGISMVNATMNAQRVLDRFHITHIVFSGIAGGVNPALHIGDVTVPAQWGQYLEVLMARETASGQFSAPPWMKDLTLARVRHDASAPGRSAQRRAADHRTQILVSRSIRRCCDVAQGLSRTDVLARCTAAAKCLSRAPQASRRRQRRVGPGLYGQQGLS